MLEKSSEHWVSSYPFRMARSRNEEELQSLKTELEAISPAALAYLESTDMERWVQCLCLNHRYGYITSDIVETIKFHFQGHQEAANIMMQRHERKNRTQPVLSTDTRNTRTYLGISGVLDAYLDIRIPRRYFAKTFMLVRISLKTAILDTKGN